MQDMTRREYNDNVEQWSGHVMRFGLWHCRSRERAEDALQEAFAELWTRREQVAVGQGLGFLLTVARRYLIDCLRHDRTADRVHNELAASLDVAVEPHGQDDLSDETLRALSRLPEVQRSILQLRDMEGYSYKEIAAMLDLSDQQVQVYLFRARVAMRKMLTENNC